MNYKLKSSEIPFMKSSKSLMHIYYTKNNKRANSMIWSNDKQILLVKFPEKHEKFDT